MGLKEILQAMEQDADLQVREVESAAEAEARSVIAKAEEEARKVREQHLASGKQRLLSEQERLFSAARLAAQHSLAAAREAWLDQAFAGARERLARLQREPRYGGYLEQLTREAIAELGTEINIEIDPGDEEVMRRIVSALGVKGEIIASLSTLGGLRASTADGCVSVVNTVEARLERVRERLRQKLAALLNSQEVS